MTVFDSDVLIDFLRGHDPGAERVARELVHGVVTITAVSAFELEAGAQTAKSQDAVAKLLDAVAVLPIGAAEARAGGRLFADLKARGQEIGMADCLIAATCVARNALLVTRNRRHFGRVPGLSMAVPGE